MKIIKNPKLKDCPFCGSNQISDEHENCVECLDCGGQVTGDYKRPEVAKAWNRRK